MCPYGFCGLAGLDDRWAGGFGLACRLSRLVGSRALEWRVCRRGVAESLRTIARIRLLSRFAVPYVSDRSCAVRSGPASRGARCAAARVRGCSGCSTCSLQAVECKGPPVLKTNTPIKALLAQRLRVRCVRIVLLRSRRVAMVTIFGRRVDPGGCRDPKSMGRRGLRSRKGTLLDQ